MESKRSLRLVICLAAVALLVLSLAGTESAAAKKFKDKDLDGAYHFAVVEIRDGVAGPVYCNAYGIIVFDGAGNAFLDGVLAYGFCSDGDDPVETENFLYEVNSWGGVLLVEQESENDWTTHCQILDKGKLLVCDGTGGDPDHFTTLTPNPHPETLLFKATAGKL